MAETMTFRLRPTKCLSLLLAKKAWQTLARIEWKCSPDFFLLALFGEHFSRSGSDLIFFRLNLIWDSIFTIVCTRLICAY